MIWTIDEVGGFLAAFENAALPDPHTLAVHRSLLSVEKGNTFDYGPYEW